MSENGSSSQVNFCNMYSDWDILSSRGLLVRNAMTFNLPYDVRMIQMLSVGNDHAGRRE